MDALKAFGDQGQGAAGRFTPEIEALNRPARRQPIGSNRDKEESQRQ
jgi:hypothetical protein